MVEITFNEIKTILRVYFETEHYSKSNKNFYKKIRQELKDLMRQDYKEYVNLESELQIYYDKKTHQNYLFFQNFKIVPTNLNDFEFSKFEIF